MAAVVLRRPAPNNLPIYPISSTGLTAAHDRLGVPVRKKTLASDSILCQQTPAVNPAWGTLCPAAWGTLLPGHYGGHCGALSGAVLRAGLEGTAGRGGKAGTGAGEKRVNGVRIFYEFNHQLFC